MGKLTLGRYGENLAGQYLNKNHYQIIAKNYRFGRLEIDIIAAKNNRLYFFEIKTRIKNNSNQDEIPLSKPQAINLKKAALHYAAINKIDSKLISFDLIIILLDRQKNVAHFKHYKNIF